MSVSGSKKSKIAPVAVVIAYYNGAAWIERALKSVAMQTLPPAEVIVVNDGSLPNEVRVLEELQGKYVFSIIHQTNGGQGSARNSGVAATKQPYICFLDQDDYYLSNHVEDLLDLIDQDSRGFAYGNAKEATEAGEIVSSHLLPHVSFHSGTVNLPSLLSKDLFVLPGAAIVSREAFLRIGGFDDRLRGYEDDDLFLRLFISGSEYVFTNEPVLVWCIRSNSTSYSPRMLESRWTYFNKLVDKFPTDRRRGLNYLVSCLIPRFEPTFLSDIYNYRTLADEALKRSIPIGKMYLKLISKQSSVPRRLVLETQTKLFFLLFSPKFLLPLLRAAYSRLAKS
jgi:glycosyltransferase involved in cell wall biosynthesis